MTDDELLTITARCHAQAGALEVLELVARELPVSSPAVAHLRAALCHWADPVAVDDAVVEALERLEGSPATRTELAVALLRAMGRATARRAGDPRRRRSTARLSLRANTSGMSALARAIDGIRAIERTQGVGEASLAAIGAILVQLGLSEERWLEGVRDSVTPSALGRRLSVDADHRLALYLLAEGPGTDSPPHEHLTWSVTACIRGEEVHRLYHRPEAGRSVRLRRELKLAPGTHMALLPDEIHATRVVSDVPTLSLQIYGMDLTEMPPFAARVFVESRT